MEQNRRARRKEHLKGEAEAKKLENLTKEIDRYFILWPYSSGALDGPLTLRISGHQSTRYNE